MMKLQYIHLYINQLKTKKLLFTRKKGEMDTSVRA